MCGTPTVILVDRLELSLMPQPWPFAVERRVAIDAQFAAWQQKNPALWNGPVLMLRHYALAHGVFRGEYLETDYASFAFWRHCGGPAAGVYDCFSAAAVQAADGAFLLGVMAPHTFNAGKIYFPCGTPDSNDIVGGRVDLEFSVRRELTEETGFDPAEFLMEPGWATVFDPPLIAHIKVFKSHESAEVLGRRALEHLAGEQKAELREIRIVRGAADINPEMESWSRAFLAQCFDAR